MSAIECSNPLRINTGTQKRIPKTVFFSLYVLTARYISIPQKNARTRVCQNAWVSLPEQIAVAVSPSCGIEPRTSMPRRNVVIRLPMSITARAAKSLFLWLSIIYPTLPV